MRKIISILLSFVFILSFTACGGNSSIMEFEPDTYIIQERVSEEITSSDLPFKGELKVDLENYNLEFTKDSKTYYATLEEFDEPLDYSGTGYHVRWDEPPTRKGWAFFNDDFEVISSYLCIYPEEKKDATAILGFFLYNRTYVDYVIIQSWNLK